MSESKALRALEHVNSEQAKRIEELETIIKDVRTLINNKGHVSKWKIYNWLEQALKG